MAAPTQPAPAGEPESGADGTPVVIDGVGQGLEGLTWFLRCAECHDLYVAREALVFNQEGNTLRLAVLWARPPRRRKPTVCAHLGALERWTGTEWVAAEPRAKEPQT